MISPSVTTIHIITMLTLKKKKKQKKKYRDLEIFKKRNARTNTTERLCCPQTRGCKVEDQKFTKIRRH